MDAGTQVGTENRDGPGLGDPALPPDGHRNQGGERNQHQTSRIVNSFIRADSESHRRGSAVAQDSVEDRHLAGGRDHSGSAH